jgi:hypothetical protein
MGSVSRPTIAGKLSTGDGKWGCEKAATGGRKPEVEARESRAYAGESGVARCDFQELLEPAGFRVTVSYV